MKDNKDIFENCEWTLRDEIEYRFNRIKCIPKNTYNGVKYFLQKVFRGYSDEEIWSLDWTFYSWIYPRLKAFREMKKVGIAVALCENFAEIEKTKNTELIDKALTEAQVKFESEIDEQLKRLERILTFCDCEDEDIKIFNEWFSKNVNFLWD